MLLNLKQQCFSSCFSIHAVAPFVAGLVLQLLCNTIFKKHEAIKIPMRTNSQPMRTRAVCRITSHPRAVINLHDYMQSIGDSCWIYYYYRTSVTKWTWNIYKLHKDGIYRLPFTECMQLWVTHLGQRWSSEMLFSFFGLFIAWSSKKVKGDFHSSLCKPKSETLVAPWWSQ